MYLLLTISSNFVQIMCSYYVCVIFCMSLGWRLMCCVFGVVDNHLYILKIKYSLGMCHTTGVSSYSYNAIFEERGYMYWTWCPQSCKWLYIRMLGLHNAI